MHTCEQQGRGPWSDQTDLVIAPTSPSASYKPKCLLYHGFTIKMNYTWTNISIKWLANAQVSTCAISVLAFIPLNLTSNRTQLSKMTPSCGDGCTLWRTCHLMMIMMMMTTMMICQAWSIKELRKPFPSSLKQNWLLYQMNITSRKAAVWGSTWMSRSSW